jgi:hypothetical protein
MSFTHITPGVAALTARSRGIIFSDTEESALQNLATIQTVVNTNYSFADKAKDADIQYFLKQADGTRADAIGSLLQSASSGVLTIGFEVRINGLNSKIDNLTKQMEAESAFTKNANKPIDHAEVPQGSSSSDQSTLLEDVRRGDSKAFAGSQEEAAKAGNLASIQPDKAEILKNAQRIHKELDHERTSIENERQLLQNRLQQLTGLCQSSAHAWSAQAQANNQEKQGQAAANQTIIKNALQNTQSSQQTAEKAYDAEIQSNQSVKDLDRAMFDSYSWIRG